MSLRRTFLLPIYASALSLAFGCGSPSRAAPSPAAPAASASASDALAFDAMRVPSHERAFDRAILFASGSSEPLASSTDALDEIARAMASTPEVSLLAVMGDAAPNEAPEIAEQRAARVMTLLGARGVDQSRLEARRFSPTAEARCGVTTPSERAVEHERELAAARAVHFAIARADERR